MSFSLRVVGFLYVVSVVSLYVILKKKLRFFRYRAVFLFGRNVVCTYITTLPLVVKSFCLFFKVIFQTVHEGHAERADLYVCVPHLSVARD